MKEGGSLELMNIQSINQPTGGIFKHSHYQPTNQPTNQPTIYFPSIPHFQ
jgi:hypothetical protein